VTDDARASLTSTLRVVTEALDAFLAHHGPDAYTQRDIWRTALSGPLPTFGVDEGVLDELRDLVIPNGARISEPGFWGWITAGPSTVAVAASLAATVASPQRYTLTAFNHLEELSLEWLGELCGLAPTMKGVYSSGGSTANLVALGAARQWSLEQHGRDPAAQGMGDLRVGVYCSREAHHTVLRAAGVLGLGRQSVRVIAADDQQRIDVVALESAIARDVAAGIIPVCVVATAGTTNTGAIDPLRTCGEIARRYGAWFHVDGAYGLPGILDERVRPLYDGLELADSVIVDPHKWLGAPVGIAATFVRDRSILHRAFTQEPADYLEGSFADADHVRVSLDSMGIPYDDFGVELSAPARGVVVWAILRDAGRAGITERIVRDNDFARLVAARAHAHENLEVLAEPTLSICCFRFVDDHTADLDELNARLLRRLVQETSYLPSATVVNGHYALRPCFINHRTQRRDVDGLVDAVLRLGRELTYP